MISKMSIPETQTVLPKDSFRGQNSKAFFYVQIFSPCLDSGPQTAENITSTEFSASMTNDTRAPPPSHGWHLFRSEHCVTECISLALLSAKLGAEGRAARLVVAEMKSRKDKETQWLNYGTRCKSWYLPSSSPNGEMGKMHLLWSGDQCRRLRSSPATCPAFENVGCPFDDSFS